jgi:hypothetical protein
MENHVFSNYVLYERGGELQCYAAMTVKVELDLL